MGRPWFNLAKTGHLKNYFFVLLLFPPVLFLSLMRIWDFKYPLTTKEGSMDIKHVPGIVTTNATPDQQTDSLPSTSNNVPGIVTTNATRDQQTDSVRSRSNDEPKIPQEDGVRGLPQNVIPNLHSLLLIDDSCKGIHVTDYIANLTLSDYPTTEETIFKNFTEDARKLTERADEQLKRILESNSNIGLNNRSGIELDSAVPNRMGMKIGSYMFFPGGHWVPLNCKAKWKVAVIIPYRNRSSSLNIFLRNIIPFLQGQDLEFGIFIAEQSFSEMMNRGLMRNIGYQMARFSGTMWDCYVFHDVDYVPLNSTNYYGCEGYPKHFATKLEEYQYTNPYLIHFGGIVGLTGQQFETVNGYSNMFWGWGGEDSDLYKRVQYKEFQITLAEDGYYRSIPHIKVTEEELSVHRHCLYQRATTRIDSDGLSKIRYENSAEISLSTLYTNITVDVVKQEWSEVIAMCRHV